MVQQGLGIGDPCTFRLIVKNITSLSPQTDPLRVEAEAALADVLASFENLESVLGGAVRSGATQPDEAVRKAFGTAFSANARLEASIKAVLAV